MRILIDVPAEDLRILDRIAASAKRSRAALIREALQAYIKTSQAGDSRPDAFGLWGEREADGLDDQNRLRAEW